jgi:3-oxoacyl-[acyl-carrier protein] reductase
VQHAFDETMRRWRQVDIVVNNLGGPPPGQPSQTTDDQWLNAFNLNFFSAVRMNRLVLPGMRQRKFGRIVTVLSLAIKQPEDNLATSTVARTATAAYAKVLSTEVAADGITVNNVLPGSIHTGRLQAVAEMQARFHQRDVSSAMDQRLDLIPARRFGKPEEAGDLIAFLASERAGFITGLSIPVDGGQLRAMF